MQSRDRTLVRLHVLSLLRVGTLRVNTAERTQTELWSRRQTQEPRILDRRLRGATFVEHEVKSIVNSPESTGMGFWSINPYVGCEFGCTYCYARYAHRYVVDRTAAAGGHPVAPESDPGWEIFEQQIYVKRREAVLRALDRDLIQVFRRHRVDRMYPIVIGTATDPYQPVEKSYGITRAVLERFGRERGLRIGIITKSPSVTRDLDVLTTLHERHRLSVYISLITTDVKLIKLFEARSPMPHVRLKALGRLTAAGIHAGLIVAPILPGLTDTESQIRDLAAAVKDAGGKFAHPSPLRLYPALHHNFLPIIERHFPQLYPRYRRAYRGTGSAPRRYTDALIRRFRSIAVSHDLPVTDPVLERNPPAASPADDQLGLWP